MGLTSRTSRERHHFSRRSTNSGRGSTLSGVGGVARRPWPLVVTLALGVSACGTSQSALVTHSSSAPSTFVCPPTTVGKAGVAPTYEPCGADHAPQVAYNASVPAIQPCPPTTTVVSQSAVAARRNRLVGAWATPGYDPTSTALGDFRVDPAPADLRPRLTVPSATGIAAHDLGGEIATPGTRTVARFGLFTGNLVIVGTDANHTLEGSRRVTAIPAWLIVTDGVEMDSTGGPPPGPGPTVAPCPSALTGAAADVVGDADGQPLANLSGGGFTPVN